MRFTGISKNMCSGDLQHVCGGRSHIIAMLRVEWRVESNTQWHLNWHSELILQETVAGK